MPQMVKQLGEFVNLESPSLDVSHLQQSAKYLADLFADVTGKKAEVIPGAMAHTFIGREATTPRF